MNKNVVLAKLIADIREIAHRYRTKAAIQLNSTIVDERWEIGKRIVEEEQKGEARAEYGTNLLKELSIRLTVEMGKGYSPRALAYYRQLYIYFPDRKILQTRLQNLTWSHLQKKNFDRRLRPKRICFYYKEEYNNDISYRCKGKRANDYARIFSDKKHQEWNAGTHCRYHLTRWNSEVLNLPRQSVQSASLTLSPPTPHVMV